MINYRKSDDKVYQLWVEYVKTVDIHSQLSVVDFVAGYNAAISGVTPKPKTSMEWVLEECEDAYCFSKTMDIDCPYHIWGTYDGEWMILGVGETETEAWDEANEFLTEE